MAKYLDETGLSTLWGKIRTLVKDSGNNTKETDNGQMEQLFKCRTTEDILRKVVKYAGLTTEQMAYVAASGTMSGDDTGTLTFAMADGTNIAHALAGTFSAASIPDVTRLALDGSRPVRFKLSGGPCRLPADMFNGCSALEECDMSQFDTSQVTEFGGGWAGMFAGCSKLATLDVSKWDTSAATNLTNIFYDCSALQSLDVSGWNTSQVTKMIGSFSGCSALTSLDVSKWDTSQVTEFSYEAFARGTFQGCSALTSLDVSKWDTSKATCMVSLFQDCSALTSIDVSNWNTSQVTLFGGGWAGMFSGCSALTSLDVSKWDTSAATGMMCLFQDCKSLQSLDVSKWDLSSVTNIINMFYACDALTTIIGTHTLEEAQAGTVAALSGLSQSVSLAQSTKLGVASVVALFNGLATVTTNQTVALAAAVYSQLTADQLAIATNKGWTVASA